MENNEKYALVTGSSDGIGKELARLFAGDKYNLILVARHQEGLEQTAQELRAAYGIEVKTIAKDLSLRESPFEVYDEVKQLGLHVDVLVNNAGQGAYGEFKDIDINRELDIVQLNIGSYIALTSCFLQDMLQQGTGKILNVGSIAGEAPGPLQAVYHGTKAFVNTWSSSIWYELKDKNIHVSLLLPGPTDTDFFNKAEMNESRMVQDMPLSDPAAVAKDGYDALMSGDDKIISGFRNKVQVGMANLQPDSMAAATMYKQQKPVEKKDE
jgi:short-subunit dehydrogenase